MRSALFLIASLALAPLAALASPDPLAAGSGVVPRSGTQHKHRQHAHAARANKKGLSKRSKKKRCPVKSSSQAVPVATTSKTTPTSTKAAEPASTSKQTEDQTGNNGGGGGGNDGLIDVDPGNCGPIGATKETTKTSGPNGSINFLNCGIDGSGWNPPMIRLQDIKYVDLNSAAASKTYKPCTKYFDLFNKYAAEFDLPPIMLAAFAMQESTCNPSTRGGGGEAGMFQLGKDNCKGAPGGNCYDIDFNTRTAAKYFAGQVKSNGGNALLALGAYNGWYKGLTKAKATAAANGGCCRCQNNLDYLHQYMNGWLQGIDAYSGGIRLGKYFNLDVCN